MAVVSCPMAFPSGATDNVIQTVRNGYRIGLTEVSWLFWRTVRDWANGKGYAFTNVGSAGSVGSGDTQPATAMSWVDAAVWCNAATEWYNERRGTAIPCAYTFNDAILRNAGLPGVDANGAVVQENGAIGFRLPTSAEWELAARWRNDPTNSVSGFSAPWFTTGASASGAAGQASADADAVAVYNAASTSAVKSRNPNALGLFDMSGNAAELCFDFFSSYNRVQRGGKYSSSSVAIGQELYISPVSAQNSVGFRLARSEPVAAPAPASLPNALAEAEAVAAVACPKTFPGGLTDSATKTVSAGYSIGKTEVSWGLWRSVRDWALAHGYVFANAGACGSAGRSDAQPATEMNWMDAVAWCNAATEWYDANRGASLTCAYTFNGTAVRDATQTGLDGNGAVIQVAGATGFRLPTSAEWELAARWQDASAANSVAGYSNPWYATGLSASGATAESDAATASVAVYKAGTTADVRSKVPNALGVYDMSGNVAEWTFDFFSSYNRVTRGGNFSSTNCPIGVENYTRPISAIITLGFRFVRN